VPPHSSLTRFTAGQKEGGGIRRSDVAEVKFAAPELH
jgi:hypothetical protein